jgi:hypothetical protein
VKPGYVWVIDKVIAGRFIQASAQVAQPGLIETVLPAGVFFGTDGTAKTSQLDLTLVGPDGNPRSFELFWKGDTGPRSVAMKPSRLLFGWYGK